MIIKSAHDWWINTNCDWDSYNILLFIQVLWVGMRHNFGMKMYKNICICIYIYIHICVCFYISRRLIHSFFSNWRCHENVHKFSMGHATIDVSHNIWVPLTAWCEPVGIITNCQRCYVLLNMTLNILIHAPYTYIAVFFFNISAIYP